MRAVKVPLRDNPLFSMGYHLFTDIPTSMRDLQYDMPGLLLVPTTLQLYAQCITDIASAAQVWFMPQPTQQHLTTACRRADRADGLSRQVHAGEGGGGDEREPYRASVARSGG